MKMTLKILAMLSRTLWLGVPLLLTFCRAAAETNTAAAPLAPYFTPATATPKSPDADGFLQRWWLLEPIKKPIRGNTVFVDSYVREVSATEYFPNQFTVVPRAGDKEIGRAHV